MAEQGEARVRARHDRELLGLQRTIPGPRPSKWSKETRTVRIFVTNKATRAQPAFTGTACSCRTGMDDVAGLNQPHIAFRGNVRVTSSRSASTGTLMYHPHSDEMVQMAMGMMGFFMLHPRRRERTRGPRFRHRMLHEWFHPAGRLTPDPRLVMTDFNLFTFNSRVWPGTAPLVVRRGQRVRVRFGNLSMDNHPIHLHGYYFEETGTDGGPVPLSTLEDRRNDGGRPRRHHARHRVRRERAR